MILLDTNVISEVMKQQPNLSVKTWLDNQVAETVFLSSITIAELLFGIGILPTGKKRDFLSSMFNGLLELFPGRILPFDIKAAQCYSELAIKARESKKGFPTPDGYIAAIAVSNGFTVATRDTAPFEAAGLKTINPWVSLKQ